jgi:hypothetical protein
MLLALAPYTGKILRAYIEKCLRDAVKMVEEWDAAAEEHEVLSLLALLCTKIQILTLFTYRTSRCWRSG